MPSPAFVNMKGTPPRQADRTTDKKNAYTGSQNRERYVVMLFFGACALRRTGQPLVRARLAQQCCAVFIAGVRERQVMLGRHARIMRERNLP